MPRTSQQNEEIRQKRIKEILTAAMHVYLEKGVRGSEIGDIAERAGIARGLVYHYYKDKLSLFRALFEQSQESARAFINSTLNTEQPPLVRLQTFFQHFMRSTLEQPYYVRFYSTLHYDAPLVYGDEAQSFMETFANSVFGPLRRVMREAMDEGVIREADPNLAANLFWGAIVGGMNEFMQRPDAPIFEVRLKQLMELTFEGFLAKR
ncbi:TetR/AcrR family transcriptional regulator [Alicyclobacillus dauci]|uniref:TetR/AcrR family transcriptional regulator n=1 Tax=Alicyclobacillus dauci TaxID=1475485 RepID=A0ABY6Z377_9BACL|nr:TetR/AcrR family transcriptional regulator [Alicyclobacillus dauci]WAH37210.1 TetR/AcrR family transcriptional regulator [Alicyclobacillus dauci]